MTKHNYISHSIRYILAALYLYSAFDKIYFSNDFEAQLFASTLIDNKWVDKLLYATPLYESFIFIILVVRERFLLGLYMSLLVMFVYTVYLIALNDFSLYEGCSCGGIFDFVNYKQHLAINILFIVINVIAIFKYPKLEVEKISS